MRVLHNRRVLLVLGGGIAAYKAPLLVRALAEAGAQVRCALTPAATHFVSPLVLKTLTRAPVATDLFESEGDIPHIELAQWPDIILIAPATASLIARLATGVANDLPTTLLLAATAPVVIAPSMNTDMLGHPATQHNLETLETWGHTIVPPDSGVLACGETGPGRMPDPSVLVESLVLRLSPRSLEGTSVVVTTGPTHEYLDPVRFITNPSSGKMGVAMARAASWLGAKVTLIAGPGVAVPYRHLHLVQHIVSVQDMSEAVHQHRSCDWLIMAAAVGDWGVASPAREKRKKDPTSVSEEWPISLCRRPDILHKVGELRKSDPTDAPRRLVGFAAESHDLQEHARRKLARKGCDVILGNWVRSEHGDTFGSDSVRLEAFWRDGSETTFGPDSKLSVALAVTTELAQRWVTHDETD